MVVHVQFLFHSPCQETPLHWAVREGQLDIVRYFVEQDANVIIKDENGVSEREYTADC